MNYHPKASFQTPIIRYYWILIYLLAIIEVLGIFYAFRIWNTLKSAVPIYMLMGVTFTSLPIFGIGSQFQIDTPYVFQLNKERYSIPWEFHPDGSVRKRGSYLRFHTAYPNFSHPPPFIDRKKKNGFQVRVSKQTSPDLLCFGDLGCKMVVGVPRSKLPVSQQLLNEINLHIKIDQNINTMQKTWVQKEDHKLLYFYQKDAVGKPRLMGFCVNAPTYITCDYLLSKREYYYNIHIGSNNEISANEWKFDKDIPLIEEGIIQLFSSFKG